MSERIGKLDGCVQIYIISQILGNHARSIWSNSLALLYTQRCSGITALFFEFLRSRDLGLKIFHWHSRCVFAEKPF